MEAPCLCRGAPRSLRVQVVCITHSLGTSGQRWASQMLICISGTGRFADERTNEWLDANLDVAPHLDTSHDRT